ncbi:MAG: hypothetical protein OEV29_10240 [Thermoleophilia bacterium]|nr:hypothetical protein [Thermoleophilia bacterium]MDH4339387.1 hypothetical protein [Thermoleophilia bacterium]
MADRGFTQRELNTALLARHVVGRPEGGRHRACTEAALAAAIPGRGWEGDA